MLIQENLSAQEKLEAFTDAAKYDMAYTSSGVRRKGKAGSIGNTSKVGTYHSLSADGRCISFLGILFTNQRIYDCKYRMNRCSNGVTRIAFTPDEVCKPTTEFYHRSHIEGLFLSSGVLYNTNHTAELIYETLHKLRNQRHSNRYIHVKTIPGADPELVERTGFLTDRMSINLELPMAEGPKNLAPGETRGKILKPMHQVQQGIAVSSHLLGYGREFKKICATERAGFVDGVALICPELAQSDALLLGNCNLSGSGQDGPDDGQKSMERVGRERKHLPNSRCARTSFVPAGQGAQMIVGATSKNDYRTMAVTQALYENYGLKRIFYSAYVSVNDDSCLPSVTARPPLLGEHRLYQADWLLRFYRFKAEELLSGEQLNLSVSLDPKCGWALRHLELFPVEINRVSYGGLLRVPGMGTKSAQRIVNARKRGRLLLEDLERMGVALKRARYFITYKGRMMEGAKLDQGYTTSCFVGDERRKAQDTENRNSLRQFNLFDDIYLETPVTSEDYYASVTGNL